MSVRSDSLGSTALRIAVIGAQTAEPESAHPYTVYRTVATYEGQCFERLIRYSEFQWFHKKLKFRNKKTVAKTFPKKKWTRKASLEDDVIEARQVLLNEFMREISRSELTPETEQCLFKLLKMGKFEDGSGRVSDLRASLQASFIKSDRGDRNARPRGPLGVVYEGDEDGDKSKPRTTDLSAAATLTATSVAFPAISSNATTVLTDDERSAIGSQPRLRAESEIAMLAAPDSVVDASPRNGTSRLPPSHPRSAPHKSQSTSIPAPSYSDIVLNRPPLKAAQSLPHGRRVKRVEFPMVTSASAPASAPAPIDTTRTTAAVDEQPELDGRLSPEAKYRERINSHLGTISRLLSESEAETEDMESARSIQPLLSMPLTA